MKSMGSTVPSMAVARHAELIPDLAWFALQRTQRTEEPRNTSARALTLRVGSATVRLEGLPAQQRENLTRRYRVFCVDSGEPDAVITMGLAETDGFLRLQRPGEICRVHTAWEEGSLVAVSYEWAGWVGPHRAAPVTGELCFASERADDPASFDRSLENFLRVLFAHLILRRGGFLLHASGLVREGKAYLFFGPSGSGKTTVTMLSPETLVLSDDLVMVLRGASSGFEACSVPFRGLLAPDPVSAGSWPVAGCFRLVQAPQERLTRVSGAPAMGELSTSLPFVLDRPEGASLAMQTLAEAARMIPIFRLEFRKDRRFWQLITAAVDDFSEDGGINS